MATISIDNLTKKLSIELSQSSGTRINIAIVTENGQFIYMSNELSEHEELIKKFIISSFKLLQVGDFSIPISGKNIIFFKISENVAIILHTTTGKIGQFMIFKKTLMNYLNPLNELIDQMGLTQTESLYQTVLEEKESLEFIKSKIEYYPKITKLGEKTLKKRKFDLNESSFINQINGLNSLSSILSSIPPNLKSKILEFFFQVLSNKWVEIPENYLFIIKCIFCKKDRLIFIPKYSLDCNSSQVLCKQIFPDECPHTFIFKINNATSKLRIRKISFEVPIIDKIDFSNLSFVNLTSFFGIEFIAHILYNLILQKKLLFIINSDEDRKYIQAFIKFFEKIFIDLSFGENIILISKDEYLNSWKNYKDFSILDFPTFSIINESLQDENFETEIKILQDILSETDEDKQIMIVFNNYKKLISLTEKLVEILQPLKNKISTENVKILFQNVFQKSITNTELRIIRELAIINFNEDLSKKIEFPPIE